MFVVFVDWLMADLINVMRHFCSTELFAFEAIFVHTLFLKVIWIFGFSICSYLVDIYAKNVVERCRNLMCERTLPSLLVISRQEGSFNDNFFLSFFGILFVLMVFFWRLLDAFLLQFTGFFSILRWLLSFVDSMRLFLFFCTSYTLVKTWILYTSWTWPAIRL